MMNQSHNQVMFNNRNAGDYGRHTTWQPQPVVNSSAYRLYNNKNWKMNKRNVSNTINANLNNNTKSHLATLQQQNRLKPRRVAKKKFTKSSAPLAPRNTTSFLIRAKKSGGIASLVSPCAVTPAVLPTPVFSPASEVLVDMAKEEWGVDGYGSMKGLIRLRNDSDEDEGVNGSGVIDVEGRLDNDLSRFEMVYPSNGGERSSLENRVADQDSHIARLEEENILFKERLFFMEREFGELRTKLQMLEVKKQVVLENDSKNDCGSNNDDNSDGNQCSVYIESNNTMDNNDENEYSLHNEDNKMDNNDLNKCSLHNEDNKMEDDDNTAVEAKDRKLNGMVANVDIGDISIELTKTIDDISCKMDKNHENKCSDHNEYHKMEENDNEIIELKETALNGMVVNVDSNEVSNELTNH